MQTFVDDVYSRFLAHVASSRKKTVEQVDAIAGGRVWSGQQAVDNGLVDALGGVDDAVAMVRKEASLADDIEVLHQPEPKNLADSLFGSLFDAAVQAGVETSALRAVLARHGHLAEFCGVLREALSGDGSARIYALMPPGLRVR
jgi:ClpP class serine protease